MATRTHGRHSSITSLLPKAQAWQASHSASHYTTTAPYLLKYRSSQWFILVTVCIALFTDSFIYGVLVPVLPFILSDRGHIESGREQLWTSALFAAFGGAILIASRESECSYTAYGRFVDVLSTVEAVTFDVDASADSQNSSLWLVCRSKHIEAVPTASWATRDGCRDCVARSERICVGFAGVACAARLLGGYCMDCRFSIDRGYSG